MTSLALAPLRAPAFRNLTGGRIVVTVGNAIAPIALAFAVLDLSKSLSALGIVVGARSLASVLCLAVGGALADRLPRHRLMVTSCLIASAAQAAIAAFVLTGAAEVPLLAVLSVVNGVASALALPASASVVVQIVGADALQQANALLRLGVNAALMAGVSLGGILVAATTPGWGLALDAGTFAVAALLFARIDTPAPDGSHAVRGLAAELRHGWTEFAARRWLWIVVLGFASINTVASGAIQVLGPVVADASIGRRGW